MKKLFLLFATVTLLTVFQSCKEKTTEENATEEVVEDVTAENPVVVDDSTTLAEDTSGGRGVKTPTEPTK